MLPSVLLNALALLLLVGLVLLVGENWGVSVGLRLLGMDLVALPLGAALAASALLATASLALKAWEQKRQAQQRIRRSGRQLEKVEIVAEAATDQVKALEAKVATLEKALEVALKRSGS